VPGDRPVDDLIPVALTSRPELAAQQALVRAALERLRQEKMRPLLPSVLLRGASTPVTGTLAGGTFGGGLNDSINHFGARGDFDLQLLWEFQNLGFGNRARVAEQRAEHQLALLEAFRLQDRVAAEVVQAHAQVVSAAERARQEYGIDARAVVGTFITGVEGRICERLRALRYGKERAVQEASGRSLVIVKAEQVKKDFEVLEIKLRHRRMRQNVWSAAAYRSGAAAGDRIPLSRGVKSEGVTGRLK